jgi:hypothetical protein
MTGVILSGASRDGRASWVRIVDRNFDDVDVLPDGSVLAIGDRGTSIMMPHRSPTEGVAGRARTLMVGARCYATGTGRCVLRCEHSAALVPDGGVSS